MDRQPRRLYYDVPRRELLERLLAAPLPLGMRAGEVRRSFHRDIYVDSGSHALAERGVWCRFRIEADDRRRLTLVMPAGPGERANRYTAPVPESDLWEVLDGGSEPARRLRGLCDPAQLEPVVQIETERHRRVGRRQWLPIPAAEFVYDSSTVRHAGLARSFQQLSVRVPRVGGVAPDVIARALDREHALRPLTTQPRDRGLLLVKWMEHEAEAIAGGARRLVVLLARSERGVACRVENGSVRLPVEEGGGEPTCRALMQRVLRTEQGDVSLVGTAPACPGRPMIEVWQTTLSPGDASATAVTLPDGEWQWIPVDRTLSLAGPAVVTDPVSLSALAVASRRLRTDRRQGSSFDAKPLATGHDAVQAGEPAGEFLSAELSELEFSARVLALAEDHRVPLLERLRFLALFSAGLDEFFMVRVGTLQRAVEGGQVESDDDQGPTSTRELLHAIAARVPLLVARQYHCWDQCRHHLAARGIRVRSWAEIDDEARESLRDYFREEIYPALTPLAMTVSAGHPFPLPPHLELAFAVSIREHGGGAARLAQVEVPSSLRRFLRLRGSRDYVPVEEVIRANLGRLYPDAAVDDAYLFRITRDAQLRPTRRRGARLLESVDQATKLRSHTRIVRIEVERAMPQSLRELLLRELQLEQGLGALALGDDDVYETGPLLDLAALRRLADINVPQLRFPPFHGRSPVPSDRPIWDVLRERDVLVHHPYDDFRDSVQRMLDEAADDPDVVAVKLTLYRAGKRSPVVAALLRAAERGAEVAAFVELNARLDEAHNVRWAKKLRDAGVRVVYGVIGLKTHAKVALIVRRENGHLRRFVHIGTGNYNADTARVYADLGLLSSDEALAEDVSELFNELTGSSSGPRRPPRRCLIAPHHLLSELLSRIEREARHARAGAGGRIRAKLNGLSDADVVRALYDASRAGVTVELLVRGVCTLRPGVPGMSERIRVVSSVGRFLEHARIYHFENAGAPEYFIGSADWRRRNLRRRVELAAPVADPLCRARLDRILNLELRDPNVWELGADGTYRRAPQPTDRVEPSVQERLLAELTPE